MENDAVADKAADLWLEHGNPDSYSRNYLILFRKWAERETTMHMPEAVAGDELQDLDIIDDNAEEEIINKISRDEKINEFKQFGAWAVQAVKLLAEGFSFGGVSKKLKIPKAELIQRLTDLSRGKGQLALDFSGGCGDEVNQN